MWTDPASRLELICSSLDTEDVAKMVLQCARLRREKQSWQGLPARADEFDVLGDLLSVPRDACMDDWMPEEWDPDYRWLCDADSD